jgi:hypothetical protein
MQESREEQKVKIAEIDMQNTKIDTQNRTIEALCALSEENVWKPTYSQVAQTGTIPPNEARKVTVSSARRNLSSPSPLATTSELLALALTARKSTHTDFSAIKGKL